MRCTPSEHPDLKHLEECADRVKEIVDAANERTRQVENLRRIQNIQSLLGDHVRFVVATEEFELRGAVKQLGVTTGSHPLLNMCRP